MVPVSRYFLCWLAFFLVLGHAAQGSVVNATWNSATDVPLIASSYTATGNTVNFTLNFVPPTGTSLTVVNNIGLPFISGAFSNLAQGQAVALSYHGVTYNFVANYYGGTGNDLELVWAGNRALAWGNNSNGQVGDGTSIQRNQMVPVTATGVLAGKTIIAMAQGDRHSLALCSDGTLAAWGSNSYGQLGNNSANDSFVPVLVNTTNGVSALFGKTVVALSAAGDRNLALCSDGTAAGWGENTYGELGNGASTDRQKVPVAVSTATGTSALYGKSVVAVSAGSDHALALCSDGTLVAWGLNAFGELGTNNQVASKVPVLVNTASGTSALFGKTVTSIAAGAYFSLVLCSDGTLVSWGYGYYGQLGTGTQTFAAYAPVQVSTVSGVSALYGKTVASITAGGDNCMALCTDGSLAAWGYNGNGQLGNNTTSQFFAPVLVNTASGVSALYGKTVVAVSTGGGHSRALCSDGTLTTWGGNFYGELGNNTTISYSPVPLVASSATLAEAQRLVASAAGFSTARFMILAATPIETVTTLAATALTPSSATLNGTVISANGSVPASFDYGTTTAYGSSVAATPGMVPEGVSTAVSAVLSGLTTNVTYHYRANDGTAVGADMTFILKNNDASLSSLVSAAGVLSPGFAPGTTDYTLSVSYLTRSISLVPTLTDADASMQINGVPVISGSASPGIPLLEGANVLTILVTAADGSTTRSYTVTVTRAQGPSLSTLVTDSAGFSPAFASNTTTYTVAVPASTGSISFTPTLVDSSSTVKVNGGTTASGSASSPVSLVYGDNSITVDVTSQDGSMTKTYVVQVSRGIPTTIAGSFDSTSSVLVVSHGFTATGSTVNFTLSYAPVPGTTLTVVNNTGLPFISGTFDNLAQGQVVSLIYNGVTYKFVATYYGGTGNDLVLIWAGTRLVGWGDNRQSQLGNQGSNLLAGSSLAGLTPVTVAAGAGYSLALFADGTLAIWGVNLGATGNSVITSSVPAFLPTAGTVLEGKVVVAVSAGGTHALALCSDGTVASWGNNRYGQLGNPVADYSLTPVAVMTAGTPLAGRTVVAICAGSIHSAALCSDGTLVEWGTNNSAEVGYSTVTPHFTPTVVPTVGKTVVSMTAGADHNIALCSDGTLLAWGANWAGQLGNGIYTGSLLPVDMTAVTTAGTVLEGKNIIAIAAGQGHSLALCSDGTLAAWGDNSYGALGNNSITASSLPVAVSTSGVLAGRIPVGVAAGDFHSLVWCSDGTVADWGRNSFGQLGNTTVGYSSNIPVLVTSPALVAGERFRQVSSTSSSESNLGLVATTFPGGNPSNDATLSGLALSAGTLTNGVQSVPFDGAQTFYLVLLDSTVTSMTVTPTAHDSHVSSLTVNGQSVASGAASSAITIVPGMNLITTAVTAQDGGTQQIYTLFVASLSNAEKWRVQYFGDPYNSGPSADAADSDNDGICNLLEYALNLNPTTANKLPATAGRNGANFEYTYTRSTAAVNAETGFTVEWSGTLSAGSWSSSGVTQTVLSDDGTTQQVKAVIPMNAASMMFVRLSVTAPPAGGF